jgi:uncharacterized Zn finger protein
MEVVANRENGLFPLPGEMKFTCDCPDSARMCKHIAAVLYGVGARLDHAPEKLFLLRGVSHDELVDVSAAVRGAAGAATSRRRIDTTALGDVFGIDMADAGKTMNSPPDKKVLAPDVTKASAMKSQPKDAKKSKRPGKSLKPALKKVKKAPAPKEEPFPAPLTGTAIRAWRTALGENQAAFAARLSVTSASISNWEKKDRQTLGVRDATLAALHAAWKLTRGLK